MNLYKFLAVFITLLVSGPAWAQSTAQTTADVVRDLVFSEAEKRIIGEHFGVTVEEMMQKSGAPEWAVKTAKGDDDEDEKDDEDRDDDEDRGAKDKKDKGKKDKGAKGDKGKGKSKGLPPGLAKRDSLPPGLQKQLDKNGRLPPGLAKRDLPADLAAKLPKRSDDQEVSVVEGDVVLIDKATGVILDVIKDVVVGEGGSTANPDGTLANPGPQSSGSEQGESALGRILKGIFGGN